MLPSAACGSTAKKEETTVQSGNISQPESSESKEIGSTEKDNPIPTVATAANTLAEDKEALKAAYAGQFEQLTYVDPETGLSITYNLYLPEDYDASGTIDAGSGGMGGGPGGGMGGASYHMASFVYAYNCIAVMEWLFQQ